MTEDEAIAELDDMTNDGFEEEAHIRADEILRQMAPPAVGDAWERAKARVGFWYS